MMNYEEFKDYIKEHILDYFPEEYQDDNVSIERILKNNDTVLDGLRILSEDRNIAPVVYLNQSFEMYENGLGVDDIVEKIARNYMENITNDLDVNVSSLSDYESVKDSIVCRLVNQENNQLRLANAPFTAMEDLAVTYHLLVMQDKEGIASIMITNDLMERYGVTVEDLHAQAISNMEKNNPPLFSTLSDIMLNNMLPDFMQEFGVDEEQAKEMLAEMIPDGGPKIYCLTNQSKVNGAASIVNPEIQEMISEKLGGDYYILPSSIHEVLIVPMSNNMNYEELQEMVQEVNSTQVIPEEQLSDHVYQYDAKNHEIVRSDGVRNHEHIPEAVDKKLTEEMGQKKMEKDALVPEKEPEMKQPAAKH